MELIKQFPVAQPNHVLAVNSFLCDLEFEKGKSYRVTVELGKRDRSLEQNALAYKWHREASEQLKDYSAEDYRAYCKAYFGVPIMCAASDEYRRQYDLIVRPHSYEDKLALMKKPIDFPVTRAMTVKQMSEYLDACYQHYRGLGVWLTNPEEYGEAA